MGCKKNLHLREIVYEYEEENKWNMSETDEQLKINNIDTLTNFEKIKHKPKHNSSEINEFQHHKKKLNHIKRG